MVGHKLFFSTLLFLGTVICRLNALHCGQNCTFTAKNGVLQSPNYPNTYGSCIWCTCNISRSDDRSISLTFETFELDRSTPTGDFIRISCASNNSFIPITYYWNSVAAPISIQWCRFAQLSFESDYTNSYSVKGFSVHYRASTLGCGNTVYTETSGNITSPNYPQPYNNNDHCMYSIWASQPSLFTLTFQSFNLESPGSRDEYDWLQVSCVGANYSTPRYSGATFPEPLNIHNCKHVLVTFHTDDADTFRGFSLQYVVTRYDSPTAKTSMTSPTTMIPRHNNQSSMTCPTTKPVRTTKPAKATIKTTKPSISTTKTKPIASTNANSEPATKTLANTNTMTRASAIPTMTSATAKQVTKNSTKRTTMTRASTKRRKMTSATSGQTTKAFTSTKPTTKTLTTAKRTTEISASTKSARMTSATTRLATKTLSTVTTAQPVTFTTTERSISTMSAVPTTDTLTTATKPAAKASTVVKRPCIKPVPTTCFYDRWEIPFIVVAVILGLFILGCIALTTLYMLLRRKRRSIRDAEAESLEEMRNRNDNRETPAVAGLSYQNIATDNRPS